MYNKAIRFLTQAIIISQLLFLPTSNLALGIDSSFKLFIFSFLVLALLFLYFLRMIHKNELLINKSGIALTLILFLVTVGISTILSIDKPLSFFGGSLNMGYSFSYLIFLTIFFFVVISHYKTKDNISFLFRTFLYTYTILVSLCYLTFLSYLFNFSFTTVLEGAIRLSVGSFTDLAMYISVVSVFIFAVSINDVGAKLLFPGHDALKFLRFLLFFSVLILVVINFLPSWICLFFGTVFILFFYRVINKASGWEVVARKEIMKKMFYVFLIIFFLILNFSNISNQIFARQLNKNLKLDYLKSFNIITEAIKAKPLFGYGGENFHYLFSKYRSDEMNTMDAWNLRYKRSASYFLEMFGSFGVIGVLIYLSLLSLLCWGVFITIKHIEKTYSKGGNISQIGILLGLIAVIMTFVVANIFYSANILLIFIFYLFLAMLFVYNKSLEINNKLLNNFKLVSKEKEPKLFISFVIKLFLLIFISTLFVVYNFKIVLAKIYYDNLTINEERLKKIITINSYEHMYELQLANYYKNQIIEESRKPNDTKDLEKMKNYYRELGALVAIFSEQKSASVVVQENIGKIYYDLESYIPGTYELSINFYLKAIDLEPSNPVILHQLARAYISGKDNKKAEFYLRQSIAKKNDYNDAKFSLAKLLGDSGKTEEATVLFEDLLEEQYNSVEVYYNLGRTYFNNKNSNLAIENFEKVLLISPNHSNALYSLALAYEDLGNDVRAKHYMNKVLKLNPGNKEIEEKLKNME